MFTQFVIIVKYHGSISACSAFITVISRVWQYTIVISRVWKYGCHWSCVRRRIPTNATLTWVGKLLGTRFICIHLFIIYITSILLYEIGIFTKLQGIVVDILTERLLGQLSKPTAPKFCYATSRLIYYRLCTDCTPLKMSVNFDISRSLKVKSNGTVWLYIYGLLLVFNSNTFMHGISRLLTRYKPAKSKWPSIRPFKLIQGQI